MKTIYNRIKHRYLQMFTQNKLSELLIINEQNIEIFVSKNTFV